MRKIINRLLDVDFSNNRSAFLWGPRRVGKSYWIKHSLKNITLIDLLKTDVFAEYASRPYLLRERYQDKSRLIVIDEIQMLPELLNEVHWMIENIGTPFLLTGSSARKLRRKHANLLAGRAIRYNMTPLSYMEVEGFDIERIMISGLIPPHFLSKEPVVDLRSYIGDYLKEEIADEARIRNISQFSEFLKVAALTSGELLNYTSVGREAGISAKVVRGYFQILEDTLMGFRIQPWRKSKNRRLIETEKFYLFDIGVTNYIIGRKPAPGTPEFGKSFEQYILMELKAYQAYRNPEMQIHYWRTSTGLEVDFILGDMEAVIEIKSGAKIHEKDFKPLRVLIEEQKIKKAIIVSFEKEPRRIMNSIIEILPWKEFLIRLWGGQII